MGVRQARGTTVGQEEGIVIGLSQERRFPLISSRLGDSEWEEKEDLWPVNPWI